MEFQNILLHEEAHTLEITIHRPKARNAISAGLLAEIQQVIDLAEANDTIRTIVLKGENGIFCTGMDFKEANQNKAGESISDGYMTVLKRFATCSKITVSLCDGVVLAGGVGFAAASDIVIATHRTQFGLSEALWGLLPANVLPYLIRRTGFQPAYFMTLTTKNISAEQAKDCHLIDLLCDDIQKEFKLLNQRLTLLHPETIHHMKTYFRELWIIDDKMEQLAMNTLTHLMSTARVKNNIDQFITKGKFPWENKQ